VLGVPVPVMQIVEVIIVWDALMATVGTVDVLMLLVLAMIGSGSHPMLHPRAQQRRADHVRCASIDKFQAAGRLPTDNSSHDPHP